MNFIKRVFTSLEALKLVELNDLISEKIPRGREGSLCNSMLLHDGTAITKFYKALCLSFKRYLDFCTCMHCVTCMHTHQILNFQYIWSYCIPIGFHSYFFCMLLWIASGNHTRDCLDDPIHYIFVINLNIRNIHRKEEKTTLIVMCE